MRDINHVSVLFIINVTDTLPSTLMLTSTRHKHDVIYCNLNDCAGEWGYSTTF